MQEMPEKSEVSAAADEAVNPMHSMPSETIPPPPKKSTWAMILAVIALLLVLASLAGLAYLWNNEQLQQEKTNNQLAKITQSVAQAQLNQRQQNDVLNAAQNQIQQLTIRTEEKTQDWQLHEARYLVQLAIFNLNFDNNVLLARQLLQNADERLKDLSSPDIIKARTALATDIAALQAITPVDTAGIVLQINAISQQIAKLPRVPQPKPSTVVVKSTQITPNTSQYWLARTQEVGEQIWQSLRNLVVIHYNVPAAQPLLPPDYYAFVVTNIQTQLSMAQWAVLHRQPQIYQASLQQAMDWITRYYAANQSNVVSLNNQLNALKAINIHPAVPDLANSLNAMEKLTTTE